MGHRGYDDNPLPPCIGENPDGECERVCPDGRECIRVYTEQ